MPRARTRAGYWEADLKEACRRLKEQGDKLWTQRQGLENLWQDIAANFYVERADFTTERSVGDEYASHLMSSFPLIARRELGNSFSAMLRPTGRPWFKLRAQDDRINKDSDARKWLDDASDMLRHYMYGSRTGFVRATKEGDHDFATFGQCVIQPSYNYDMTGLLYRTWHLRDCVWAENEERQIDTFHRKWKIPVRSLYKRFSRAGELHARIRDRLRTDPHGEVECRHIVVPADDYEYVNREAYDRQRKKQPFVSIYIDCEHDILLEEVGVPDLGYTIPRWQTVSGSQYARSPVTEITLPDARLLQQMMLTILEAGQKAVDPPMIAAREAIQGSINVMAGAVTYVDAEYDERLGEVLRPLTRDVRSLSFGKEMIADLRELISHGMLLNKINLPEATKEMTAFEVQKRMDEYVRGALPLFEPLEVEYNGALCEQSMTLLMRVNAFGPPQAMPEVLQGADVHFVFESPLQSATDRAKTEAFHEVATVAQVAAQIAQLNDGTLDLSTAVRDAIDGTGAPASWVNSRQTQAQIAQAKEDAAAQASQAQQIGQGAQVAEQIGKGVQSLQGAGVLPTNPLEVMAGGADPNMANVHVPPEAVQ
jgi:hypothetical protein